MDSDAKAVLIGIVAILLFLFGIASLVAYSTAHMYDGLTREGGTLVCSDPNGKIVRFD